MTDKITTVLWDVDGTLLDFIAAEKAAIRKLFKEYDLGECTDEMLSLLDVLVDGEFIEAQKNISLAFRGSENQRLIDVPATLSSGSVVWHGLVSQNISMKY